MSRLRQDLLYAFRSLRRRPGFVSVAVLTLALGIGATTAIYSVVNAVLLRPLPYPESERIVALWEREVTDARELKLGQISVPNFRDVSEASTSFDALAQFRGANITYGGEEMAELITGGEVTPDFFRVFGAEPVLGRSFTADEARFEGPRVAILSHGFWQERMAGDRSVIGRTLQLQGATYEVVGVAPEGFDFPNAARIWLPVQNDESGCGRGCVLFAGLGLLKAGVSPQQAQAEVEHIAARLADEYPRPNTGVTIDLATLRDVAVGDVQFALFVVFGAVIMVLLIACANVANLMLVRGTARRAEMALRAMLGASRRRLVAQLVTESAVLALAGAAAGLLFAVWSVELLRHHAPADLPRIAEISLDGGAVFFALLVAAGTVLLFGLAPALQLSATPFRDALREHGRTDTGRRQRGRVLILAGEVTLSVCLLLGAGLLFRSLVEMRRVDPGFDPDGVVQFRIGLPGARYSDPALSVQFVETVAERLTALPGVENAGFVVGLPLGRIRIFGGFTRMDRPPPEPGEGPSVSYRFIDPGYLPAMRIRLLAGRGFDARDRAGTLPVALVNRSLANRYFPGEDPIGKQVDLQVSVGYPDTLPRTIVGIVDDVRAVSLTDAPEEALYVPEAQAGAGFGHFVIRSTREAGEVLRGARHVVASVDDQIPVQRAGTLAELVSADTAGHRFYLLLIGLFAALAATLAAVGMYGVVAFVVARRTREIGLRLALGATAHQLVSLVVWQGLRPALIGAAFGLAGALAASRLLARLLFGVAPHDPGTVGGVLLLLLGIVALACFVPARRATRVPPAAALRAD